MRGKGLKVQHVEGMDACRAGIRLQGALNRVKKYISGH